MNTFSEVMEKLKSAKNIALFAHENPDGDALGSLVAAKAVLEEMDKRAVICLNEEPPKKFSYLLDGNFKVLPENEEYSPIELTPEDFESGSARILGVAIEMKIKF